MRRIGGFALLLLLSGCAKAYLVPEDRVKYELGRFDDLLLSTFRWDWEDRIPKKLGQSIIHVEVSVLVQNSAEKAPYTIQVNEAKLEFKGGSAPAKCTWNKDRTEGLSLAPGKKASLSCGSDVVPNAAPTLKTSDQFAQFVIPYRADGKSGHLKVAYKLKAEDFEP